MRSKYFCSLAAVAFIFVSVAVGRAQTGSGNEGKPAMTMTGDMSNCPMMKSGNADAAKPMDHDAMVLANGEKAMGFSQTATTHHFLLFADGGAIQVEANDPADTVDRDHIRTHLTMIAQQFSQGIFTTPFAVHGKVPDGVPVMDQLKADIKYSYEQTPNGARIRISTNNPDALNAIQEFIRFQINQHHTGDPLNLEK